MAYPSISVNATTVDATGLKLKAWDKLLAMRAMPEDIFFALGGNYSSVLKQIPNGIYMKIPAGGAQANTVTFPLLMPLSGDPGMGIGTDPITNAEQQALRQFTAYYNDYDKSVKSTASGIEYIDGAPYGLMDKITDQIGVFLKEMFGYWVRYALLNRYSPNLQATPTSLSTFPHPNTLIKGINISAQPAERYTTTGGALSSIIASLFGSVPAGTAGALDVGTILGAQDYFRYVKGIKPMTVPGVAQASYVLTVPTSQKTYNINPSNTDGLGAVWQATSRYQGKDECSLPGYLGRVGDTILIEDNRAPRAAAYGTGSGSNANSTTNAVLVDRYLKPGYNDGRSSLTGDVMEACFFLGSGAIADIEPESPHYETEGQMLKKLQVKGALGSRGFNRMDMDKSTGTSTTMVNQSSGILWTRYQETSI